MYRPNRTALRYLFHQSPSLTQFIDEANDGDKKSALTALIFLEDIRRDMKVYKSTKLRRFLGKSIKVNKKINYYDYYFD
jgi:hypothetical protein